jgi:hypothetical protein
MPRKTARRESELGLLFGARALAGYIFGDQEQWRKVYPLKHELGLFRLRGQICGRPTTINQRIAEREKTAATA